MRFALGSFLHRVSYPPFRRPPGSVTVGFDESSFASLRTLGQGLGFVNDSLSFTLMPPLGVNTRQFNEVSSPVNEFVSYAAVILDVAVDKTLDYGITATQLTLVQPGTRVEVPVKGYPRPGYVVAVKDKPDFSPVKQIGKILSDSPLITEELFQLAIWMAKYYCCPLRQVFKIILPSSVRKVMQPKQQLFVMRNKSREELRELTEELRNKHSAQANVLDAMLQVKKGILLSELLEKTGGSRSPSTH